LSKSFPANRGNFCPYEQALGYGIKLSVINPLSDNAPGCALLYFFTLSNARWFYQGSYKTWMSLNLKTKIQGLECPWICKEVLESPLIFLALVFGYFLKLFDIQNGHFIELILYIYFWQSCLKLIKVAFWTIQRQIVLISNPFCQYLVLGIVDTWPWMSLKSPWIWLFLTCTNPVLRNCQGESVATPWVNWIRRTLNIICCNETAQPAHNLAPTKNSRAKHRDYK
jgi:hypothetical protein